MLVERQPQLSSVTLPRILMFPGSLRRNSHQGRLVEYLKIHLEGRFEIDILRPEQVDLPLFNQDMEHIPAILDDVRALHRRFAWADGVVIASPEYNGHVSPYLKNTFDWVSRLPRVDADYAGLYPFRDKPLLLTSASTGWTGGLLGLRDARSLFGYLGYLVASEQICVSDAEQWISDGTFQFEEAFAGHIVRVLSHFSSMVDRLRIPRAEIDHLPISEKERRYV